MALESQGVYIRRGSSIAGSTGNLSTNTVGFIAASKRITRQAGFADFITGMRIEVAGSASNDGVYTVSATAGTYMTVYETVADEASGATAVLEGHLMQPIGQVISFNGPALTANVIDITHLQSTAKEKHIGLVDSGNLSISVIFDNESSSTSLHNALERDLAARTKRKFDIKYTDEGSVSSQPSANYFEGYITAFGITGAVDNVLKADLTIAISTGVDWIDPV